MAHEIEVWGYVSFTPKLRRQNPLTFWEYFDPVTNKHERLVRLYDLHQSSYSSLNESCPLCLEADWDAINESRGDAFRVVKSDINASWIAPRRHFTNFDEMPKRDKKAVQDLLQTEMIKTLSLGDGVQVCKRFHTGGHVYYQIDYLK